MTCHRLLLVAVCAVLSSALVTLGGRDAVAQAWPSKNITLVVGFAPGGFTDVLARLVASKLGQRLGHNVIVENRPGAGGNIAHRIVAGAAPDGYTLLAASTSIAINDSLYENKGYATSDFTTITISASTPEVLANHPSRPETTLKDVVAAARNKPVNFGTAGAGSGSYIAAEYFFKHLAQVPATHVPFQGGAPAIAATIGNQIDLLAVAMAGGVVQPIQSGQLRGLGVASAKRVSVLPDVPTYSEAGFAGFTATAWAGYFAPARIDPAIVRKLNAEIDAIMKEPDVLAKLRPAGFDPIYGAQPKAENMFQSELANWGKMVGAIGVKIK